MTNGKPQKKGYQSSEFYSINFGWLSSDIKKTTCKFWNNQNFDNHFVVSKSVC